MTRPRFDREPSVDNLLILKNTMYRVAIIGCGVVGAAIAYELSLLPGLEVHGFDQQPPAQAATGAALGVLMGVISQKVKGRNWRLRETSLQRYETLIPELEAQLGRPLPMNRQGILSLCFDDQELPRWQSLQEIRARQGYPLEIWSPDRVALTCPHIQVEQVVAGIFSPRDRQIDPTALTLALVEAAQARGVQFHFQVPVTGFEPLPAPDLGQAITLTTAPGPFTADHFPADYVVIAAGLGSTALTTQLHQPIIIGPVLGQALRLQVSSPLGSPDFQPVINGNDIHLVPLGGNHYWVGATVEFPPDANPECLLTLNPEEERLEEVLAGAITFCPALAQATITQTWLGLRPRPQGQAAPIITQLPGYPQVWVATGHYRNGILLAPATALAIQAQVRQYFQMGEA